MDRKTLSGKISESRLVWRELRDMDVGVGGYQFSRQLNPNHQRVMTETEGIYNVRTKPKVCFIRYN